jgi:hypothetical protein
MSVLRKLFGGGSAEPPVIPQTPTTLAVTLFEGDEQLEVKGEGSHQDNLSLVVRELGREVAAVLMPEPDNEYDSYAVAVMVGGLKVGYLSRDDAESYQPSVMRLQSEHGQPIALMGRIFGGEPDKPSYGIWLSHDPTDFGLTSAAELIAQANNRDSGGVWTGTRAAKLPWMERLPSDRLARIKYLRGHLGSETDPVERHFIHNELEEALYKARDSFDSALAEYEAACVTHDTEMDVVRPLLVEALGGVPYLPTYKQASIMRAKAKDPAGALWWAERGLALYGPDGLRPEMVDDLRQRAGKYRSRLGSSD